MLSSDILYSYSLTSLTSTLLLSLYVRSSFPMYFCTILNTVNASITSGIGAAASTRVQNYLSLLLTTRILDNSPEL